MTHSEQINELAAAFAKASKAFPPIERGRTAKVKMKNGGEYSYDYADLGDVLNTVRGCLADNGLTISHDCKVMVDPLRVETTCRLEHSSGQWKESSPLMLPCDGLMSETQQVGSASTYGRRYTTYCMLGLSPDSDDDGNAASGNEATTARRELLPACPKCGKQSSVIVGKAEYGGGLVCFKKKDGCGHAWKPDNGNAEPAKPAAKPMLTAADKAQIEELGTALTAMGLPKPTEDGVKRKAHGNAVCRYVTNGDVCYDDAATVPGAAKRVLAALIALGADKKSEDIYWEARDKAGLLTDLDRQGRAAFGE